MKKFEFDNKLNDKELDIERLHKTFSELSLGIKTLIKERVDTVAATSLKLAEIKLPKIELPPFELPKIELPVINIPEINYERICKITKSNSKFGWTLTSEMSIGDYLNGELVDANMNQVDSYFYNYYTYKDEELGDVFYKNVKNSIIGNIEKKWIDLLKECFTCYDSGLFKVAIPNLMLVIEGEISSIANSNLIGKKLIKYWKRDFKTKSSQIDAIILYSIFHFLQDSLFLSKDFSEDRPDIINRNWILHGRDNPEQWTKKDYFRLVNTLSSLQFVKEIMD
ncbi:hypothetical protein ACFFHH_20160 [Cytobacillus solani]|uniref:hypothetical protein n=1 Tax=Cytobacillus solani TaxID=1637975 RepID=UPI00114F1187|nr:hypothetical protein [Cytobacillus solani]